MNYYLLGRSGLRVSRLALGTMTFGSEWGWGAEKDGARQLFDAYRDAGGNFYDTADLYTNGTSEKWLGEFVRDTGSRDEAVVSTKFTFNGTQGNPNAGGNGRKNILRAVEGSLKRLQTDYIDLYFLHAWDGFTRAEEVARTLDDLVSSGKVRYVGLSDVPAWYASRVQTLAEWRGYEPVTALQLEYSLVERAIENEYVDIARELGPGIMVWSPLAGGLLSGKYKPGKDGEVEGKGRLATVKGSDNAAFDKFNDRNFEIVAELEKVAEELGQPMASVATNWAASQPGIGSVIIGATKLHQLEGNLKALDFEIPAELMARLDEASATKPGFPYSFFQPGMQGMITGGATVGDKPAGYAHPRLVDAEPAGSQ